MAFRPPAASGQITAPCLQHVRCLTVVTTGGAPWWFRVVIGDPHRRLFTRGLRVLMHSRCKVHWLQLNDMNNTGQARRAAFLARVARHFRQLR